MGSDQEALWSGEFGDEYTLRNHPEPRHREPFFRRILERTGRLGSVLELGANKGHNLEALAAVDPDLRLTGVEPNGTAFRELSARGPRIRAIRSTIQDLAEDESFDLVFTSGVLIHVAPEDLDRVYHRMFAMTRRFLLVNEYFNPVPVEIPYRGHTRALFKRDFGGDLLDRFPGRLEVLDYGFLWRRMEPGWGDSTWWLFGKTG